MESVAVVAGQYEHLQSIPGIEVAAASMFSEEDLPIGIRHAVTDMEELRQAVDDLRLWVAVTEPAKPVGFALTGIVDDQAYIEELNVLPEYGRRGVGKRLVVAAIDWARRAGFASLCLVTFRHLPWNAPFYEKLGFGVLLRVDRGMEISARIEEEEKIGIDTSKRVAMRLVL